MIHAARQARTWCGMLAFALSLGACSLVQGARLWAPEAAGFEAVRPRLYVQAGMPARTRAELRDALRWAHEAVRRAYGETRSRPVVCACQTEACYRAFGGRGSTAKVYGDRILLSPRGLDRHFLAHEWSHAELHHRLSVRGYFRVPSWFDEGLAVAISEAPKHSEAHWQYLMRTGVERPSGDELMRIESLSQWIAAVHRYGEDQNEKREARGEPRVAPLYAAAGHEVRPWLAEAGTAGLLKLIERVNSGDVFDAAYRDIVPRRWPDLSGQGTNIGLGVR